MTTATPSASSRRVTGFAAHLSQYGDAPALVDDDRTMTYAELAHEVRRIGCQLGAGRKLVQVEAANRMPAVAAYLACLAEGHVALLVQAEDSAARIAQTYEPDATVSVGEAGFEIDVLRETSTHDLHPDLALLLSTSGSTGAPKLVRLSHENVESNAESIAVYLSLTGEDRAITTLPMQYCYGLSVINSHLFAGAALIMTELSVVDRCFWRLFAHRRATSFAGVPHTFELLDRVGFASMDLPSLRYVTQAGGRLEPELVEKYARLGEQRGFELFVMYGQTEATARMAYLPPSMAAGRTNAIGRPIPGGELRIEPLGEEGRPGEGELVYRGPNVMLGYAETAVDLARGRDIEELRTGDIARVGGDGLFEIVGRKHDFLKLFGLRIDLGELDRLLACRGTVARCTGDDTGLVVAVEGGSDPEATRRVVSEAVGIPIGAVSVAVFDALPRLSSGKLDVQAVKQTADDARRQDRRDAATTSAGDDLRALFATVLGRPDAGPQDTFVSLGGDSLSYVEMSLALEETLGKLPDGWHVTAIGELSALGRRRPGRRATRQIETSVLLRAVATILIVGTHIRIFSVPGSAHVLLAVAGYNFARFLMAPEDRRERFKGQVRAIMRIAVPSMAWIGIAAVVGGTYGLANVLLLNSVLGPETWTDLWQYWFVEVLVYMMIAMTLVTAVPAVAHWERRRPFWFAMSLVVAGLVLRFRIVDIGLLNTKAAFWLFALGWASVVARSTAQRVIVSAAAVAAVPGYFGDADREVVIAIGFLALVWVPSVRIPPVLTRPVSILAASSLYVYLVQWQAIDLFPGSPWLALFAALAGGVAYWWAATKAMAVLEQVAPRLPALFTRTDRGVRERAAQPAEAGACG